MYVHIRILIITLNLNAAKTSLSQSFEMVDDNFPLADQLEGSNQEKHLEDTDGRLEHSDREGKFDSSHELEGSEQLGMYSSLERREDWADGLVGAEPVAGGDKTFEMVLESSGECDQVGCYHSYIFYTSIN